MYDTLEEAVKSLSEWKIKRKDELEPLVEKLAYRPTFNTDCHREAVFRRFIELAESTIVLHEKKLLIGAVVTARATQETFAVMWFINIQLERLSKTKDLSYFLLKMHRLSLGWSNREEFPEKINVLNCINAVDKLIGGGFRGHYDLLSELAHPNYSGTLSVYTKPDHESFKITIGSYPRSQKRLESTIEDTLIISISLLGYIQEKYDSVLEKALEICITLDEQGKLHDIFYNENLTRHCS